MKNLQSMTQEEIRELWQDLKAKEEIYAKKNTELHERIEKEILEATDGMSKFGIFIFDEREYRKKQPEHIRTMLNERDKARYAIRKAPMRFFLSAIILSVVFILCSLLSISYFEIDSFDPFAAGAISVVVAFGISCVINVRTKTRCQKTLLQINSREEIKKYDTEKTVAEETKEKEAEYIRKEKYKDEKKEIDEFYEEYRSVRSLMIKEEYGDSAFFYFEKFGEFADKDVCYEIDVDGITVVYSRNERFQRIGVNPGYHTIDLILYSDNRQYSLTFHFQVSEKNLPLCVVCNEVSAHHGNCREVAFEEFDRRYSYLIK